MATTTERVLCGVLDGETVVQTAPTMTDALAMFSAALNARPWAEVRAGIPAWHPLNDGDDDGDDGTGFFPEDDDADVEEEIESDDAQDGGDGDDPEGDGDPEGDDADPVNELLRRFDTFKGEITSLVQQRPAAEPAADDEPADDRTVDEVLDDLGVTDDDVDDETGQLTTEAQLRLIRQLAREEASKVVAPDRAERAQERRDRECDELEEKYPALKDDAVQDKAIKRALAFAQNVGRAAGLSTQQIRELAAEPTTIETAYLAMEAESRSAAESPGGSGKRPVQVERGTTAAPSKKRKTPDEGDAIVAATTGSRYRLK